MAIKRFTIEIDDSQDISGVTSIPPSLIGKEQLLPLTKEITGTPEQQPDYSVHETDEKQKEDGIVETIGRTPSDLFFTFINRSEFIVVVFIFISFFLCIGKINNINDIWLPLIISLILSVAWFGIKLLRYIRLQIKNRKK